MIKRHQRPRSVKDAQKGGEVGGIIEKEGPIHVSNVMLLDPRTTSRPGSVERADGKRQARSPREPEGIWTRWKPRPNSRQQAAPPPRLRERYEQEVMPALIQSSATRRRWRCRAGEDHPEHGRRRGEAEHQDARGRAASSSRRSPASSRTCAAREVDRLLQGPRGDAGRRRRDPAPARACGSSSTGSDSIAIPRIRDFRGLNPRSFDGRGNYSMGVREQMIFPEIDYDSIDEVRGLDMTITTTAADRRGGLRAARRARACRSPRRVAPARRTPRREAEEERRKEEARERAEAEAGRPRAAQGGEPRGLRQAREARGGRGGRGGAEGERPRRRRRSREPPTRRSRADGEDIAEGAAAAASPSSRPAATTAAAAAAGRAPTTASSASAGSACARPPTRATSPE